MTKPVQCPRCGSHTKTGVRFCTACGASLSVPVVGTVKRPLPGRRVARRALWLAIIVALLLVISLAALAAPALFLRALAVGGIVLMMVSVGLVLLTYSRPRRVSAFSQLISMAMSVVCLGLYVLWLGMPLEPAAVLTVLVLGLFVGAVWSLTAKLYLEEGAIKSRANVWYLAVWAAVFAATQVAALVTGRPPTVAMALLVSGTGLVLGQNGSMLTRLVLMRGRAAS